MQAYGSVATVRFGTGSNRNQTTKVTEPDRTNIHCTLGIFSCKTFFYHIFYVNDLVLPEKWL